MKTSAKHFGLVIGP